MFFHSQVCKQGSLCADTTPTISETSADNLGANIYLQFLEMADNRSGQEAKEVEGLDHDNHALPSLSSVKSQSPVIVIDLAEIASNNAGRIAAHKKSLPLLKSELQVVRELSALSNY